MEPDQNFVSVQTTGTTSAPSDDSVPRQKAASGDYDAVWPRSARGIDTHRLADRLETLDHKRIAFLWDYLFRGDELFPVLAVALQDRYPTIEIVDYSEFGNLHGADEKERIGRLPDDLRSRGIDAVVSGMGC